MVAIGGIADIVQHRHKMARSRMTQSGPRCGDKFAMQQAQGIAYSITLGFDDTMQEPLQADAFAQAIVAKVIHYCGLLFEQPSELRYARLIGYVDLKRRDCDAPLIEHGKIGANRRLHGARRVGDPVVGIPAAVPAHFDS
jgi:hypothetical protein